MRTGDPMPRPTVTRLFCSALLLASFLIIHPAWAKKVSGHADRDATLDAIIKKTIKAVPGWAKWEAAALNREAVIGMPQILFELVVAGWKCDVHSTQLAHDEYRNQYDCAGAFSRKPYKFQGKYFYTEGKVVRSGEGKSYKDGSLMAVQGN